MREIVYCAVMLDELLCVLKLRETGDMQKGTSRSPGTSCNQVKDADCRLVPLDEDLARAVPFFVYHLSFLFLMVDFCALKRYNCKQLMN